MNSYIAGEFEREIDEVPLKIGSVEVGYFEATATILWSVCDGRLLVEVDGWKCHGIDVVRAASMGSVVPIGLLACCEDYAKKNMPFFTRLVMMRDGSTIRDHLYSDKREHALPQSAFL